MKTIGFYNAINPVGSGLNIADDIEVKQFFDERGGASGSYTAILPRNWRTRSSIASGEAARNSVVCHR